jgi:ribosomal protein S27AE
MTDEKPILVLDFDGVLHSYVSGWRGADVIPDPPVPGAQEFCEKALDRFRVLIVSSRCNQPGGTLAITNWLTEHKFPMGIGVSVDGSKPAARVTLDDRALTFEGRWPSIEALVNFKPWHKRRCPSCGSTRVMTDNVTGLWCAECDYSVLWK